MVFLVTILIFVTDDVEKTIQRARRKQGSAKEMPKKKKKQASSKESCVKCGSASDDKESNIPWIACDICDEWFHGRCLSMTKKAVDSFAGKKKFKCPSCTSGN